MAELENMSQKDIAKKLNLTHSGAKSRVQRGRGMIKQILLDCCHLEFDRRGSVIGYENRKKDCSHCSGEC